MMFLKGFVLFTAMTAVCALEDDLNHITANKCAGIRSTNGQPCSPTACAIQNTSCPLIPDVLCASDKCGCQAAFLAVVNRSGREERIDVTDLCWATAEIIESGEFMELLLAGEGQGRDLVASDPNVLLRVFKGLNILTVKQLKWWKSTLDSVYSQDLSPVIEKRRQYFLFEIAALEERMRRRDSDDIRNAVSRFGNSSNASSKEAQKELQRRKGIIRQWTKQQEQVQVLDEGVSISTLLTSARMASRKYAVDNQGSIIGFQLPIYGNILQNFALTGFGIPNDETITLYDPDNGYKFGELYNQLKHIVLDEIIARRQFRRNNFHFSLPPVSAMNSRVRYHFRGLGPLLSQTGGLEDGNVVLRLVSMGLQTAALGMDLYNKISGQSPTTLGYLADSVLDWNNADDLTELLF